MKFEDSSSVQQKVANKNGKLNKTMNAGRQKINVEKDVIKLGVDKRAKDGTVVTVGKQIVDNATTLNPFSDKKE